jgi:GNAT superfamily N-acetyltransferase
MTVPTANNIYVIDLFRNRCLTPSGNMTGGLIGKIFWNWMDAELVWVEKPFRGCGLGKDVVWKAEEIARNRRLVLAGGRNFVKPPGRRSARGRCGQYRPKRVVRVC